MLTLAEAIGNPIKDSPKISYGDVVRYAKQAVELQVELVATMHDLIKHLGGEVGDEDFSY